MTQLNRIIFSMLLAPLWLNAVELKIVREGGEGLKLIKRVVNNPLALLEKCRHQWVANPPFGSDNSNCMIKLESAAPEASELIENSRISKVSLPVSYNQVSQSKLVFQKDGLRTTVVFFPTVIRVFARGRTLGQAMQDIQQLEIPNQVQFKFMRALIDRDNAEIDQTSQGFLADEDQGFPKLVEGIIKSDASKKVCDKNPHSTEYTVCMTYADSVFAEFKRHPDDAFLNADKTYFGKKIQFEGKEIEFEYFFSLGWNMPAGGGVDVELRVVTDYYEMMASDRGIHFSYSGVQASIMGDRPLFQRMLGNLIENALAHTPADESILLEAKIVGDRVVIQVIDSGSGIAEQSLRLVFDRFRREGRDSSGRVGLGLPITRAIAAVHGGTVELRRRPGKGTIAEIIFPKV